MREQPKYASTHTFAYLLIIFECIKKRKAKKRTKSLNQTIFSMNKYFEREREKALTHTHTRAHMVRINANNVQDFIGTTRATTE